MANYPRLPVYRMTSGMSAEELYREIRQFADLLGYELDTRDNQIDNKPASKVLTVVTVASIGRPANGDIVFAASAGKFRGYVSGTGWVDFN
jgi:hypothetical protein